MGKNNITFQTMTEDERKKYLGEHFLYEVRMLFFALQEFIRLSNIELGEQESKISYKNIALECFLLHAKLLLEFFYDDGKTIHGSEVRAWHFYGNNKDDWTKLRPEKTEEIKEFEKRVNNELSHFGVLRVKDFSIKNWPALEILHDFMDVVVVFVKNLPEEYSDVKLKLKY